MPIFRRLKAFLWNIDTHVTLDDHSVSKVVETVKSIKHRLDERKYVKDFILVILSTFAFILLFSIAELPCSPAHFFWLTHADASSLPWSCVRRPEPFSSKQHETG